MTLLSVLDILLVIVGGAGMIYQGLCIVLSLFAKPVRFPDAPMTNRYAVLISARNEENVIGNLIGSIRDQTYPSDLIDIWLVDPLAARGMCSPIGCSTCSPNASDASTILNWLARDMR